MQLYFEIFFDDNNSYNIDNIKTITKSNILSKYGYGIEFLDGGNSDSYSVIIDLECDNYFMSGELLPIIQKIKINYLRKLKLNKIKNEILL